MFAITVDFGLAYSYQRLLVAEAGAWLLVSDGIMHVSSHKRRLETMILIQDSAGSTRSAAGGLD